jgi:hypothetical protein
MYRPRRRSACFGYHVFTVHDQLAKANCGPLVDLLHATEHIGRHCGGQYWVDAKPGHEMKNSSS